MYKKWTKNKYVTHKQTTTTEFQATLYQTKVLTHTLPLKFSLKNLYVVTTNGIWNNGFNTKITFSAFQMDKYPLYKVRTNYNTNIASQAFLKVKKNIKYSKERF